MRLTGAFIDRLNSQGAANYVLTSTGSNGTQWVDASSSSIIGLPYVTIATTQTVTGAKTFTGDVEMHFQEPSGASVARKGFVGVTSSAGAQKFKILTNNSTVDGYARFKIDRAYGYGN